MRGWRYCQSFSSPWVLVEFAAEDAWNLHSEATDVVVPAGQSSRRGPRALYWSEFDQLHADAHLDRQVRMEDASAPQPPHHHNLNLNNHNNTRLNQVCPFLVSPSFVPLAVDIMDVDSAAGRGGTGSARRRRERQLRQHWRHEQLTLQMLLATYQHHAAPRGQTTARSGEWGSELNYTATIRRTPTPQAAGAQYFAMDVDEVPAAGSRPDRLTEVRPQERVLRRTVEQNVEPVRGVPVLDAPVPQMVEHVVDVLKIIDRGPPEQVIEVPEVSLQDVVPLRAALRESQLAEQLVDVPTAPGYVLAVVAVQTLGWRDARALFERLAASPGRDTNTGRRDGD